jgi:hypothetical protein
MKFEIKHRMSNSCDDGILFLFVTKTTGCRNQRLYCSVLWLLIRFNLTWGICTLIACDVIHTRGILSSGYDAV